MGKRGPKPKAAGRPIDRERPYAPRGLDAAAKAAWDSLCDDLEALGTLARVDRKLIELYAETFALWEKAGEELSGQSLVIQGEKRGHLNPLVNLRLSLGSKLRQLLLDFGLSPSTRAPAAEDLGDWGAVIGGDLGAL